jgi:hypothetical protein
MLFMDARDFIYGKGRNYRASGLYLPAARKDCQNAATD